MKPSSACPSGPRHVAQCLGPGGQDEAEQRLPVGRATLGGLGCPGHGLLIVGLARLAGAEQRCGRAIAQQRAGLPLQGRARLHAGDAAQIQRGDHGLRFEEALGGGPLQPARALCRAGRHAAAFQVAARHQEFRLGMAGLGHRGQQLEGLGRLAFLQQRLAALDLGSRR